MFEPCSSIAGAMCEIFAKLALHMFHTVTAHTKCLSSWFTLCNVQVNTKDTLVALEQIQNAIVELETNLSAKIITVSGMQRVHRVRAYSCLLPMHTLA
jgi:hypothetical protein